VNLNLKKKHPAKINRKRPSSNSFSIFVILLIILSLIGLYYTYWYYSHDLPDLTKITGYNPPLITEVYSSNGKLIGEFATQKRKLISYEDTPKHVQDAFLAIEDKRFFQHKGVDFTRIIAALIKNIQEREIVQGASTITQQVTKNLILSPEKSISRKIKEAILAYRMENNLSKEEIFYIYLNHIYLADGTYGIEAASKNYFGKSAKDINIAEAALLAGLPKRPEYFSPRKHLDRALERQRLVLKIMEDEKFISKEQRKEAEEYKIQILPRRIKTYEVAPYFVELVRQHIESMVGTKAFLNGGYKIFTTLDVDQSLAAQWALRKGILELETRRGRKLVLKHLKNEADIKRFRKSNKIENIEIGKTYKAVIIDQAKTNVDGVYSATTGIGDLEGRFIYAISSPLGTAVNGLSFELSEKFAPLNGYDGISLLPSKLKVGDVIRLKVKNYKDDNLELSLDLRPDSQGAILAMDSDGNIRALVGGYNFYDSQFNRATQALRQPGSSFKPFVYSAAIDKGFTETSVVYDIPVSIKDWSPNNYDGNYLGAIPLRKALVKSRNLATVRVILDIDPKHVANYAKQFGFKSHLNPYPSLALGGSDVTLLELVKAYNVFATGGKLKEPKFITRIYDRYERILEDNITGHFISQEQKQEENSDKKRFKILEKIASSIGKTFRKRDNDEYVKEEVLKDNTISINDENAVFLTPQEFLNKLQSSTIKSDYSAAEKQVISSETAFILTDLLRAVISEGTGQRAKHLTSIAPLAGKTGTTNDFTDAWFIGYSPDITVGVWVGKDNHTSLGKGEAGSRAALPIWIDFMKMALPQYSNNEFEVPKGIEFVDTPYGSIPYTTDSLMHETLVDIGNIENSFIESHYREKDFESKDLVEEEVEIDFLLRR